MAADLEEWNDKRSKRKVGRFLQSSVEFFGAQLRILRATTTSRRAVSAETAGRPHVTNRCNQRHLTLPRHRGHPPVTSRPCPSLAPHSLRRVHLPTDRSTAPAAENNQMGSSAGQAAVVNCFNREKETHAPSCRFRRSAIPTHTD